MKDIKSNVHPKILGLAGVISFVSLVSAASAAPLSASSADVFAKLIENSAQSTGLLAAACSAPSPTNLPVEGCPVSMSSGGGTQGNVLIIEDSFPPDANGKCPNGAAATKDTSGNIIGGCYTVMTTGGNPTANIADAMSTCSNLVTYPGGNWRIPTGADLMAERSDSEALPNWFTTFNSVFHTNQWTSDLGSPSGSNTPGVVDIWTSYVYPSSPTPVGYVYCFADFAY